MPPKTVRYKIGDGPGNIVRLHTRNDFLVVQYGREIEKAEQTLKGASNLLLSRIKKVDHFPHDNIQLYKSNLDLPFSPQKIRDDVRRKFKDEDVVNFAGRGLVNKRGRRHLYKNDLFIKFYDEVDIHEMEEILNKHELQPSLLILYSKNAAWVRHASITGLEVFDLAIQLREEPSVQYCHPEVIQKSAIQNEINPNQWYLKDTEINAVKINAHINISDVWNDTKGEGVVIAIIDRGFDMKHEELIDIEYVSPFDMIRRNRDPSPVYVGDNHGTPCLGIACARGKYGTYGVAPRAKVMPIRTGTLLGSKEEAEAIARAANEGADIISCSWGPHQEFMVAPANNVELVLPDSTRLAIEYAVKEGRGGKGCLVLFSAGNANIDIKHNSYASNENVLAIGASNDTSERCAYSNHGKKLFCLFPSHDKSVSIAGITNPPPLTKGIWTTDRIGRPGYSETNYVDNFEGTSASCPGVAGVLALMLSVNNNLHANEIKDILQDSCDRIGDDQSYDLSNHSILYGFGRINAKKAVLNMKETILEDPNIQLSISILFRNSKIFRYLGKTLNQEGTPIELSIRPVPKIPGVDVDYEAYYKGVDYSVSEKNGTPASINDKRRTIIGISARLSGVKSINYSLHYAIKTKIVNNWISAKDGEYCGANPEDGESIVAIKFELLRRSGL